MAARPLSSLPDELMEAILLRIPPDDPQDLIRAAVACKHWHRLISGPSFRRGFHDLHRTPPMLGILRNYLVRGVPTIKFCPTYSFREYHHHDWQAIDSRHGRVLLHRKVSMGFARRLAVWNPVTGEQRILPVLQPFETPWSNFNAAVLCASGGGCDHIDCRRHGPFRVVFMITNREKMASYIYSSETNAWTESTSPFLGKFCRSARCALVEKENSLYFVLQTTPRILCYNLGTQELTVIDSPPMMNDRPVPITNDRLALMTGEGGGLGCATMDGSHNSSQLYLWSRKVGPDGDIRWTLSKTIKLGILKPGGDSMLTLDVVGFADGGGFIFVGTDRGAFATNLKSGCVKRVNWDTKCDSIVPYVCFYTPALGMASIHVDPRGDEPPTISSKLIKNLGASLCEMAPEVLPNEALPGKKKPVETTIGGSKTTGEDK